MELHLALNEVTAEGAANLAVALARLNRLQVLSLRENELENDGAIAIAQALTHLPQLRTLDLAQNQAGSHALLTKFVSFLWPCTESPI